MNTEPSLTADMRSTAVLWANTWGLNFLAFGLLLDILYRSLVFHEAPWDLFALIIASGVISSVYAARHKALMFSRKLVLTMVLVAIVAALVSAILAMTEGM